MEVNGIAHIFITAGDFDKSREFYRKLLPFLGLKPVLDAAGTYYCIGGRTGLVGVYEHHDYAPEVIEALLTWQQHVQVVVGAAGAEVIKLRA